jgi:SET domain-containing protein
VVVYVALRDIEPGEELILNYGPFYDPLQSWKEVKQEESEHAAMQ